MQSRDRIFSLLYALITAATVCVACSKDGGDAMDSRSVDASDNTGTADTGMPAAGGGQGGSAGLGGAAETGGKGGTAGVVGGQGGGTGGVTQQGACFTQTCLGRCDGSSCGGTWICVTGVACTADIVAYCGCDGQTFEGSSSCASKAYAAKGACEEISCDPKKVVCKSLPPTCKANEVPSVRNACWGPCVRIDQCTCKEATDCPLPNIYTCHSKRACGPYVN